MFGTAFNLVTSVKEAKYEQGNETERLEEGEDGCKATATGGEEERKN